MIGRKKPSQLENLKKALDKQKGKPKKSAAQKKADERWGKNEK